MNRPRLLDLFCGAGGAAMGYHRAGFDVCGVDIVDQPHYPFLFKQRDALEVLRTGFIGHNTWLMDFDAIHASPPCQAYSTLNNFVLGRDYVDLYAETRELLQATGLPWVIENVIGAPYQQGVVLCGSSFGLGVRRHRNFETSFLILGPPACRHREQGPVVSVCGHPGGVRALRGRAGSTAEWKEAMGIDWMPAKHLAQAIPPAYTEFIGAQLLQHLSSTARAS